MAPMTAGMAEVVQGLDESELVAVGRWLTGTVAVMREAALALAEENRGGDPKESA
uniref:MarR family transcriptional regulator n=1 Tax=Streptomyces sp. NBC_00049 TaxID=2903617 RepID=A0AAU2K332_9ACTN